MWLSEWLTDGRTDGLTEWLVCGFFGCLASYLVAVWLPWTTHSLIDSITDAIIFAVIVVTVIVVVVVAFTVCRCRLLVNEQAHLRLVNTNK